MRIVADPKACYGCRVCELVCAYHHRGVFAAGEGSIRVRKDNRNGKIYLSVDSTCNLCEGRSGPFCVQYCNYNALKVYKKEKYNGKPSNGRVLGRKDPESGSRKRKDLDRGDR